MKRAFLISASVILLPALAFAQDGGLQSYGAYESDGFANGIFVSAICDLFDLVGGSFGALLTTAAIATGIVAASVGGFSELRGAVMVAVASFAITAGVSLYFGSFPCGAGNGGGPAQGGGVGPGGAPIGGADPFGDE